MSERSRSNSSSKAGSKGGKGGQSSQAKPRSKAARRPAEPPRKRHWLRNLIISVVLLAAAGVGIFFLLLSRTTVPTPNEVTTSEATIVYWADGTGEIGRLGDATRRSVDLADIPVDVQNAVLAAEDRDFYNHGGISPIGIGRAIWNNLSGGSTQGASTITQQYAKNAFLTQERSWDRKLKEALLSVKLETLVGKEQILGDYLNSIYFGRGAYGIEAASIAYFGVPASQLTVEQGAVLASIIKSPSGLAPEDNLEGLEGRWNYVMDAMVDQGWLSQKQRLKAQFPKVKKLKAKDRLGGQTGFLLSMVEDQLRDLGYDDTEIQRGGLRITSTFDKAAQKAATVAVRKVGPQSGTEGLRIGLAAVRPGTGEIIAIYGGKDYVDDQINNATRQFAQAGSTFKPFALAAAAEQEIPLNSVWNGDSPATINGYTLTNYGDKSYGEVTLLKATENSINTAYVEVEDAVGVDSVADVAVRAGVPADTPGMDLGELNLTFVLGTASPSGLDMANAYATFAASGQHAANTVIKEIIGANGGLLYQYEPSPDSVLDPAVADTVTYALHKVVTDGTGSTAQALGRPAAGKTGTTDDNKSAWFVGYTPQLATAVLMAKETPEGIPVSLSGTGGLATVTGGSFPAAIWTAFMTGALDGLDAVDFPEPPEGVDEPLDCPVEFTPDVTEIPAGCPTPEVITEFGPTEGAVPPSDPAVEVAPTDIPPLESETPGAPTPTTFAPEPTPTPPPVEPVDEGRP